MHPTHKMSSLADEVRKLAQSKPAKGVEVRRAIHDLTLHALRSRLLAAEHLSNVTRTVGNSIGELLVEPVASARAAAGHAFAGLGDAALKGLLAIELATREFADAGGRLSAEESRQILNEVGKLEQSLGKDWQHEHSQLPANTPQRIATLITHIRRAATDAPQDAEAIQPLIRELRASAKGGADAAIGTARILGLMASGALLGVAEVLQESSTADSA